MSAPLVSRRWSVAVSLALVAFCFPTRATATPIATFDFNTAPTNKQYTNNGVTITLSTGFALDSAYDGDGHVVGSFLGTTFVPHTLGTTDGGVLRPLDVNGKIAYDGFIKNSGADRFSLTFSERVFSVAYDYQIFPNASDDPPARPDLTVNAYDGTTLVFSRHYLGDFPALPGLIRSRFDATENYAQALGSDEFSVAGGFTRLEIVDWPVTVAIDNLQATTNRSGTVPTPEPASVFTWLLCAGAFGGTAFWLNRRRSAVAVV